MTIAKGGITNQGMTIGVLMLETVFPRIPGDVGNGWTFDFPVMYRQVTGANPTSVVKNADPALLKPFIEGAQALEAAGCKAIATSCGFLVMFQKEMAAAVNVPVISSSLLQVPFVSRLLGPDKKVGIITAKASSLTEKHFKGAGMEGCSFAIQGMEEFPEFFRTFIENHDTMDVEKATAEMREAGRKLVRENPGVGAIVLECTNMPPFAYAVQEATGLPVYDVVTLIRHTAMSVVRGPFAIRSL